MLTKTFVGAAMALAWLGLGQTADPAGRLVGQDRGHDINVSLPLPTGSEFQQTVFRVAATAGVAVGLELVADPTQPERISATAKYPRTVKLNGRSVGDALQLLGASAPPVSEAAKYAGDGISVVPDTTGVIHVSAIRRATFLDTVLPSFSVKSQSLASAIQQIHRVFDKEYPLAPQSRAVSIIAPLGADPAEYVRNLNAATDQKVSVSLDGVTVRKALDALVIAHGRASWFVTYADLNGTYSNCRIGFRTLEGGGQALSARK